MKKIAVFMGGLMLDSQRKILESIYKKMDELHVDVYAFTNQVLHNQGEKILHGSHQVMRFLDFSQFDGVVIAPNTIIQVETRDWLLEEIQKLKLPTVCIDYKMEGMASVMGDNYEGMYELTEHLVKVHGKRRINYLSGPDKNKNAQQRKQAFLDAMNASGIPVDPVQIFEGNFAPESAKRAYAYWEREIGEQPEVIICANDAMAQGILIELNIRGLRVPEDVVVTGADNSSIARESEPRLTSIERFYGEMGEKASELLLRAGRGEDISGVVEHFPSRVVIAESCGCRGRDKMDIKEYRHSHMIDHFYIKEISSNVKAMISDFSGAESFQDVVEYLKPYVARTDADSFYLCINDLSVLFPKGDSEHLEEEKSNSPLTEGYTEYMTIPLAYEDRKFTSYGPYQSKNVLPSEVWRKEKSMHYVVTPLYYQDESFGYCVFGNSNFPLDREQCYTWILTISGAIQNVRRNLQLQGIVDVLNHMWIYDTLTRVYNRAGFFNVSKALIQEAREERRGMYLLFLDVDGLKKVNDNLGHEAGDRYICAIADVLKRVTDEDELVMRYGGDEFAVMGKFRDYNRADEVIKGIETELAAENKSGKYEFQLSASIGHEIFNPQQDVNLGAVLERADQKMYEQKRRKRDAR